MIIIDVAFSQWNFLIGIVGISLNIIYALASSALKESYREVLSSSGSVHIQWVILSASEQLLRERLGSRKGHFFDINLLDTQLQALELPEYGWVLDVAGTPESTVDLILEKLDGI